jgi:hypothetical protein
MGVAQHHDAISGTEKQEVAFDYVQRLSDGIHIAQVCSNNRILWQFRNILCTMKHRRTHMKQHGTYSILIRFQCFCSFFLDSLFRFYLECHQSSLF